MPANTKSNGRFELPQLTPVNYSLTDGTDIPPPPDSPIEEAPPAAAPKPEATETSAPATNGQSTNGNGVYDGRGRTNGHDQPPMSPASSKRPSSIRRFLSRKSLNSNYTNGTNHNRSREDVTMMDRPESSLSFVDGRPGLRTKKSGSWFRRLASGGSTNRTSVVYEEKKIQMGPPPPKLPELNQLKAKIPEDDEGSLGAEDMFKNIK